MSEALLLDSDWEIVELQSFSFSKRQAVGVENQENMNYDGVAHATAELAAVNRGHVVADGGGGPGKRQL